MVGKIIKIKSNIYTVSSNEEIYEGTLRGKLKIGEITPVVGDEVEFEILDENIAVINSILDRKTFMKRPKVSNISQIMFVNSTKMPKPNLLMLDKELIFAEFSNIKPIIVINKIDLDEKEAKRLKEIYTNVRI